MENEKLIKKWLAGELTESEWEKFRQLEDFDLNNEILKNAERFKASHFSSVKKHADHEIFSNLNNSNVIKLLPYKTIFKIAALFVIGLSIYFTFFYNPTIRIETLAGQHRTFELPDASSVSLNADSQIRYQKKKWAYNRTLLLTGEAFFNVAKGSKFDVITSGGTISVLGTQFSVKNRKDYFEVKCFEGVVSVKSRKKNHRLTKGKAYRIINNVVKADSIFKNQPAWISNISSFKSVPLYEVLAEFERQYNITFSFKDIDTKRLFTGGFVHNDIEQALEAVTVPFNLTYTKNNSKKITLYKSE